MVWPETDKLAVECPSVRETIGMFAAVNVVAAFVMAIFGNSAVKRFLMCGPLPKRKCLGRMFSGYSDESPCELGGSISIKYTPGYEYGFNVWELWRFFQLSPDLVGLSV